MNLRTGTERDGTWNLVYVRRPGEQESISRQRPAMLIGVHAAHRARHVEKQRQIPSPFQILVFRPRDALLESSVVLVPRAAPARLVWSTRRPGGPQSRVGWVRAILWDRWAGVRRPMG